MRLGPIALLLLLVIVVALPVVVVEGRDARPNVLLPPVVTALDGDRLLGTATAAIGSNALSSLTVVDGADELLLLVLLLAKRVGIGATGKIGLGRSVNAGADAVDDDDDDDETCGNAG